MVYSGRKHLASLSHNIKKCEDRAMGVNDDVQTQHPSIPF